MSGGSSGDGDGHTVWISYDASRPACPHCLRPIQGQPVEISRNWEDRPKLVLFLGCNECLAQLLERHGELVRKVDELERAEDARERAARSENDPLRYRCPTCWARPGKNCRRRVQGVTYTDPPCRRRLQMAGLPW